VTARRDRGAAPQDSRQLAGPAPPRDRRCPQRRPSTNSRQRGGPAIQSVTLSFLA
jgi:hypothetical protein